MMKGVLHFKQSQNHQNNSNINFQNYFMHIKYILDGKNLMILNHYLIIKGIIHFYLKTND